MPAPCTAWTTLGGRVTVHTGERNANRLLTPIQAERLADELREAARKARAIGSNKEE